MKTKLMNDLKEAMKEKDIIKKNTIQGIRAAILQEEKDKQKELTNTDIENIIVKEKKKRLDLLKQLENTDRQDTINETNKEIEVINKYLPKQLTREEIEKEVETYMKPLTDITIKEMGSIIKDLKQKLGNTADPKTISELVKEKILNK